MDGGWAGKVYPDGRVEVEILAIVEADVSCGDVTKGNLLCLDCHSSVGSYE